MGRSRRTWGALRQLPSGRWQASYADPESRQLTPAPGTFATKSAADRWLAVDVASFAGLVSGAARAAERAQTVRLPSKHVSPRPAAAPAASIGPDDGVRACVFDAYGTLFDVHSATRRHSDELGEEAESISRTWRAKQLEYSWLRTMMGRYVDFWRVTADALDYSLALHGVVAPATRRHLLDDYLHLDAYPEVAGVLAELKGLGLPCAILSNGSPAMLGAAVTAAGLDGCFDAVLSVDELGVYKPDARVYQLAVDRLGVSPKTIAFQSSNAWDAAGATSFGLRVTWVNRFRQPPERLDQQPHHEIPDLSALPDLVRPTGDRGRS